MRQRPLNLGGNSKSELRTQFGALCWRQHKGDIQIALCTSRRTKRWILPKGWPVDGAAAAAAAETEAYEEAGLEGRISDVCVGLYSYTKIAEDGGQDLPVMVAVFPLKVKRIHQTWPEMKERKRRWMSQKKAAATVEFPELARIIRDFDPRGISL